MTGVRGENKDTSNRPQLSIIIVNYNGRRFLEDCLESIDRHVNCSHEIIMVDNASNDDSMEFVQKRFPHVRLIASKSNTGFTGGNNKGAMIARGDLLLLLNNDTLLLNDIKPAVDEFNDPTLGVLGCRLLWEDRTLQPSFGFDHNPIRLILFWTGLRRFFPKTRQFALTEADKDYYFSTQNNVDWVSGAFMLTRRSLWGDLNGLDERYFMYIEDVDFCRRVRETGFRVAYSPHVELIHYGGGGKAWIGEAAVRRSVRSYLIYTRKFYGRAWVLSVRIGLFFVFMCLFVGHSFFKIFQIDKYGFEKASAFIGVSVMLLTGPV